MTTWTPEHHEHIARRLAEGFSFSVIAAELETTRSAIAGVIHRNKILQMIGRPRRPAAKLAARPPKPERKTMTRKADTPPARAMPAPIRPPDPLPVMRRVTLVELRGFGFECRFPVGEDPRVLGRHLFCGAPVPLDRPYCRHHATIAAGPRRNDDG